jgi:hypothetical protein
MHLYNEWLHRLILLRDSLLPFENFDEVPLQLPPGGRGIREAEKERKQFLVHSLTGNIPNAAIVDLAKVFTGPDLLRGGYGFQYAQGLVLPAFISGSSSAHLLRYHAAKVEAVGDVIFEYENKSYIEAPKSEVADEKAVTRPNLAPSGALKTSLSFSKGRQSASRVVELRLELGSGKCVVVDLGQITRGRRYAYELLSQGEKSAASDSDEDGVVIHNAADLLALPGLVVSPRAKEGQQKLHVVPAADAVVKLAFLGKLYPENVVIGGWRGSLGAARGAGKGFSERFVIVDGE